MMIAMHPSHDGLASTIKQLVNSHQDQDTRAFVRDSSSDDNQALLHTLVL